MASSLFGPDPSHQSGASDFSGVEGSGVDRGRSASAVQGLNRIGVATPANSEEPLWKLTLRACARCWSACS